MFELRELLMFQAVAKTGNVSRAAESLNMTQPALSRALKNLEDELGALLFERGKNKVSLSETGIFAAEKVKVFLEQAKRLQDEIAEFYRTHCALNIASCAPCAALKYLESALNQCFPATPVISAVESEEKIREDILSGRIQLGIFTSHADLSAFASVELYSERLFALVPLSHALSKEKSGIYFSQIDGEPVIPFPLKGYWNSLIEENLPHSQKLYQASVSAFDAIINASSIITFTSDAMLRVPENHAAIPVLDSAAEIRYCLACAPESRERFSPLFVFVRENPCRAHA